MPRQIRPSGGDAPTTFVNLNVKGFKRGDLVLYKGILGWRIAAIDFDDLGADNTMRIGIESVDVRKILGRVPPGADHASIIATLEAADTVMFEAMKEAREACERLTTSFLKQIGVK